MKKKKLTLAIGATDFSYMVNRSGSASFKEPLFAFVKPAKLGHIRTVTDLTYCRESFCEYVRQQLRDVNDHGIDLNKIHMVSHRRVIKGVNLERNLTTFKNQTAAAVVMLNVIEKNYGWPLTKMYPIQDITGIPTNNAFYYIVASRRWIKAPAMLSLFTLLFRIAAEDGKYNFKGRIKSIKALYTVLSDASSKSGSCELAYYRTHGSLWPVVLDNYRKLFSERDMADLYYPGGGDYFFSEGINSLCDLDTKDSELSDTFLNIMKKERSHLFK